MSIIPIINLGGGKVDRKKYIIKDGILQDGFDFVSNINNFGGVTIGNYYRFTRTSGSGVALGRTTIPFNFSGNKKLYIEGYTTGANSNNAGTHASSTITDQANISDRVNLPEVEGTIVITPTTASEYIYLISFSGAFYGYIKNMWIE